MADYVEGKRPVIEAMRTDVPLKKILMADNAKREPMIEDILRKARQRDIPVIRVPRAELDEIYSGVDKDADVIAYCRIGERSSHTWFVLTHLLGYPHVRNYDGSWTEWGNAVRVPIVRGDEPGTAPVA